MITLDYSEEFPYAYYDDNEGVTSANNPDFWYALAMIKPNYPMPALRYRTVSSLINLGYVSALNDFDTDVVFEHYIKE